MTTISKDIAIELLRDLARGFTRHHGDLRVDGADMNSAMVLALKGNADDHPKLVGTRGKHIQALKAIFAAVGARAGRRIDLTLLEPDHGHKGPQAEFTPCPQWTPDTMLALLRRVLDVTLPSAYTITALRLGDMWHLEVTPERRCQICTTLDVPGSLHAIFHAIGKTEGAIVHIGFAQRESRSGT